MCFIVVFLLLEFSAHVDMQDGDVHHLTCVPKNTVKKMTQSFSFVIFTVILVRAQSSCDYLNRQLDVCSHSQVVGHNKPKARGTKARRNREEAVTVNEGKKRVVYFER